MRFQRLAPGLFLLWLAGCGDGAILPTQGETEQEPDIIIVENAVPIDSTDLRLVSDSTEKVGGIYKFLIIGSPPSIEAGDILVGDQGGGFLRRVGSVSVSGDTATTRTTLASLSNVIKKGSFETNLRIATESSIPPYGAALRSENGGLSLNNTTLYDGPVCQDLFSTPPCPNLRLVIEEGEISIDQRVDIGGEFVVIGLEEFHAIATGSLDLSVVASLETSGALEKGASIKVATFFQPFSLLIGNVPVVGLIRLDFVATFSVGSSGPVSITTGFNTQDSLSIGARYQNSAWESVFEINDSFSPVESDWSVTGEVEVKLGVKPELSVLFYGVAGPFLSAEPYLKFIGVTEDDTWKTRLAAAVLVELGMEIKVLSFSIADWSKSIATAEEVILESGGEITPPPKIFASSGTVNLVPSDLFSVEIDERGHDSLLGRLRTNDGFEPAITDLAFSRSAGLWGVSFGRLYQIDTLSAVVQEVSGIDSLNLNSLAFDSLDNLYAGNDEGYLFSIDTETARADTIGHLGYQFSHINDLAFSPDGILFASAVTPFRISALVTIDTESAEASYVNFGLGFDNVFGLAFVEGELFGLTFGFSEGGELIRINTETGRGEFVRKLAFNAFGARPKRQQ